MHRGSFNWRPLAGVTLCSTHAPITLYVTSATATVALYILDLAGTEAYSPASDPEVYVEGNSVKGIVRYDAETVVESFILTRILHEYPAICGLTIRGQRVILDAGLARIYGVQTKRLNEQVRRCADRFPSDFAFLLTPQEVAVLMSQCATSSLQDYGNQQDGATGRKLRPVQNATLAIFPALSPNTERSRPKMSGDSGDLE